MCMCIYIYYIYGIQRDTYQIQDPAYRKCVGCRRSHSDENCCTNLREADSWFTLYVLWYAFNYFIYIYTYVCLCMYVYIYIYIIYIYMCAWYVLRCHINETIYRLRLCRRPLFLNIRFYVIWVLRWSGIRYRICGAIWLRIAYVKSRFAWFWDFSVLQFC